MAGELLQTFGRRSAWFSCYKCPAELKGNLYSLVSKEGEAFEIEAEGLIYAQRPFKQAVELGPNAKIELPFKTAIVAKVVEYMKHHKDNVPQELKTPLVSDNLTESGATKFDANFINCDKDLLFELIIASTMMDMSSLLILSIAKASLLIKEKTPDKLIKDFKMNGDLPEEEEETLTTVFTEMMEKSKGYVDESGIGGIGAILTLVLQAAEKNEMYTSDPDVSLKSWRQSTWRAMILKDWTQLAEAPEELQSDKDLAQAVLALSHGASIKYATPEMKADPKYMKEAVKNKGGLLAEAAEALKSDPEFVLGCVELSPASFAHATDGLRSSTDMVRECARRGHGKAVKYALSNIRSDKDFIINELLDLDPAAYSGAADELLGKSFAMQCVEKNPRTIKYMDHVLQADLDIAAMAVGDPEALKYIHASTRQRLGAMMPYDTEDNLFTTAKYQYNKGVGRIGHSTAGKRTFQCLSKEESLALETPTFWHKWKMQKIVQFSALSTMTANMGQSNYIAANSWLDKQMQYERPEIDGVTLMWGAVGGIGMRWKAFASQDMLNGTPEALLQVEDASIVLHMTTTRMSEVEWYAASFFDEYTREFMLKETAGVIKGSETAEPVQRAAAPTIRRRRKEEDDEPKSAPMSAPESGPLGGWPVLGDYGLGAEAPAATLLPDAPLEEGGRVQLVNLQAKTGQTGTLVKHNKDGKWKVRMDIGGGIALLQACYLVAIAEAAPLAA